MLTMPEERVRLNWPNRVTLTRIVLIPAFLIAALQVQRAPTANWSTVMRWLAFAIFFLMSAGDALDGLLARQRNLQTELGRLLDPAADKMLMISAYVLLASRRWVQPIPDWVTVVVVSRDVFIAVGFVFIRLVTGGFPLRVSWLGKVCTTSQMVTVLVVLSGDALVGLEGRLMLFGLTVVLTVLSGVDYMFQARYLLSNQRPASPRVS